MISNNDKGNKYHDEKGRFCRATDNAIPYLNDEGTKSSGYSKNEVFQNKSWEEMSTKERNSFIEANYTTPMALKLFKDKFKEETNIKELWEPADYDQYLDKRGVDVVGETEFGRQYAIDLKCASNKIGEEVDPGKSFEHSIILFRFDPNQQKETDGWIFKNNYTDFVGFTAFDTPYTKEDLYRLGSDRTKAKYMNRASLTYVNKMILRNYIVNNFKSQEDLRSLYESYKHILMEEGLKSKTIELQGQDGNTVNLVISKDKNHENGGYVATLYMSSKIMCDKCNAKWWGRQIKHKSRT